MGPIGKLRSLGGTSLNMQFYPVFSCSGYLLLVRYQCDCRSFLMRKFLLSLSSRDTPTPVDATTVQQKWRSNSWVIDYRRVTVWPYRRSVTIRLVRNVTLAFLHFAAQGILEDNEAGYRKVPEARVVHASLHATRPRQGQRHRGKGHTYCQGTVTTPS